MSEIIHGVVRTDLMHGTDTGVDLVSAKYFVTESGNQVEKEIDNGNVVLLGNLMEGEREVYSAATPAANSALKDVVMVATPEVMYDERLKGLHNYYNIAGKIIRGYRFHQHDKFSLTKEALEGTEGAGGTLAVGSLIELMAGTKLKAVKTATSGSTQVGKIIAIETAGRYTYYVIEVA